jgi:hypothetical protein
MKYTEDRSYADPEKAAERILEIANSVRTVASISSNGPFLFDDKGTPAEYRAGLG